MTPDHDAAKKWAGSLGPENTFGVCGPDMLNLARAYLDLLSRERRAVGLLRRFEKFYGQPTPTLRDDVHAFLAERGEV